MGRREPAAAVDVQVGDETFALLPGRAALRRSTGELLVSDVHLGKDEAFARAGRALPTGATAAELEKISRLLHASRASKLTILGDLTHHELGDDSETLELLHDWLQVHAPFEPLLVHGNHDRHARQQVEHLPLEVVDEPLTVAGIDYRHCPPERSWELPWVAGHVHPGMVLDVRSDRMKVPIFWIREGSGLVLPAFGDFTGLFLVAAGPSDAAFAAGSEAVVALPSVTRLP